MSLDEDDKRWIRAELERVEAGLLSEFRRRDSPAEMRRRTHSAVLNMLDAEIEALKGWQSFEAVVRRRVPGIL